MIPTEFDFLFLATLASYHSEKKSAAVKLALHEFEPSREYLTDALGHMQSARGHWEQIVKRADGVYNAKLVFGYSPGANRRNGHHHSGHWKDRVPEINSDVAQLETKLQAHDASQDKTTKP